MEQIPYQYHFDNVSEERLRCGGFALYQYGELWCNPDSLIGLHPQSCYELTYAVSGSGTVLTGGQAHRVRQHDCVLSLPGENHEICPDRDNPLRFVFLGFERNSGNPSCAYLFDALGRQFRDEAVRCVAMQDQSALIVRLFSELQSDSPFRLEMAGYLLAELLIDFIRSGSDTRQVPLYPKITDDSVLVYRLETYITRNIAALTRLQDLGDIFNYNYSYLSRRFYRITGKHLNDFYISCRMQEANRLLGEGLSVTQVSDHMGYSSIHSFSRSYKNHFGVNPSVRTE
ncbi:MAG: AraC family transcriptional regulator [Eubacteriales bacterium]|nr:AraC family transcriptional regulator [Eubacteriales bacterium]